MTPKDYYAVLGITPKADSQQVKAAYRNLAFQYHPDRNNADAAAAEKMKAINEAYAVLSHPRKRQEYDRLREQFGSSAYQQFRQSYSEQDIFKDSDIYQIFEEMARSFGLRGGDDIFKEFYGQGYRSFEFRRPGFTARGFILSGRLNRAGIRRKQAAETGYLGRASKFLLEKIGGVKFPEKGKDRQDQIRISPELARQGGPYAYFLKEKSKKLVVKVPAGIRDGQRIRLAGMGSEGKGGAAAGNLYLTVRIRKPLLKKVRDYLGF
ncbi:MAG: DnaJ domain-containing protein [Thermodesulfobacteriota bacterium]